MVLARDISDDTKNVRSDKSENAVANKALSEVNQYRAEGPAAEKDTPKAPGTTTTDGAVKFGSFSDLYGGEHIEQDKNSDGKVGAIVGAIGSGAAIAAGEGSSNNQNADKVTNRDSKPDPKDPFDGKGIDDISASGVNQRGIGDCFFESALASLANSPKGQKTIQNMIELNGDGSYKVTFPGDKGHPVTVTQSDLDQNMNNGQVGDSKTWSRVIETAFLKYDGIAQYGGGPINPTKEGVPILGKVTTTDKALELLTGQSAATDSLGFLNIDNREITLGGASKDNVARFLTDAINRGDPITAGASESGMLSAVGWNDSGAMAGDHVYSVTGFDPKSGTVTVRNPWGNNNGTAFEKEGTTKDGITSCADGQLKMSLDTFMKYFADVNAAGENPVFNDLHNLGQDVLNRLGAGGHTLGDVFSGNFGNVPNDLMDNFHDTLQIGSDLVYGGTDTLWRGVKSAISAGGDLITNPVGTLQDLGGSVIDGAGTLVAGAGDLGSGLVNGVTTVGSDLLGGAGDIIGGAGDFLSNFNPFG